jgi:hypothetical protein
MRIIDLVPSDEGLLHGRGAPLGEIHVGRAGSDVVRAPLDRERPGRVLPEHGRNLGQHHVRLRFEAVAREIEVDAIDYRASLFREISFDPVRRF